ncbi:sucrose-6-phosphate hydrolase [Alkalibacterium kapii]|uniref:Sucrose-6-phosphate hydrolase n=1 Tax=Alkalibacterium kapii TaxID=426704 RepID=A0A511AT85_9LACT|nr:sucrose-6-phosphate hydrolase [Alkalibacterium kapii]
MEKNKIVDDHTINYHIRAQKGLINDPNGLIYFKDKYHVFFQWNPEGTTHENKHWGHAVSDDLVNWSYLKPALSPDNWYDKNGCYSGSAIEKDGKLYIFYTGNVKKAQGERESYQCLAVSKDGIHFEKHGPLFEHPGDYTAHVRDPKVWKGNESYWMVLGAQTQDLKGTAIIYSSKDLLSWDFQGELTDEPSDFGYMWECPDLLRLNKKDVFVFSPQGIEAKGTLYQNIFQTGYMLGHFENGRFTPEIKEFNEMDRGFEFYAPQSFEDDQGRTLVFGWMGAMPPKQEAAVPTVKDGWIHHLSLPREIMFVKNQLIQKPVDELKKLRIQSYDMLKDISKKDNVLFTTSEQEITCKWDTCASSFTWTLRNEIDLRYEASERKFTIERTNWLDSTRETRTVYLKETLSSLQLFLEDSAMEVFLNDGREVFSLRYFNNERTDSWTWLNKDWLSNLSQFMIFELEKTIKL